MAQVPELSDELINTLLDQAAGLPEAQHLGFHAPDRNSAFHWFSRPSGDGFHSAGDGVTQDFFRAAVRDVLETRGNLRGANNTVIAAYWDLTRNAPEDWTAQTALTLANIAPLCGVLTEVFDQNG